VDGGEHGQCLPIGKVRRPIARRPVAM
jgi:hypothetical protein